MSDAALRDAAARERAQSSFDRPLLVEAGAGTGKTAMLVLRIVVWSLGPGWERALGREASRSHAQLAAEVLERVAAITFTEAAAAEMAARVASALARVAAGESLEGLAQRAAACLPHDAAELRARAEALVASLDRLTLRTIHAFCRRLLAAYPLEAGLHPELRVDADAQLAADAARQVIEEHLAAALAGGLHPDYEALADAGHGPRDLQDALIELLAEGARPEDLCEDALSEERVAELVAEIVELAEEIAHLEDGVLAGTPAKKSAELCEGLRALAAQLRAAPPRGPADLVQLARTDRKAAITRLGEWAAGRFGKTEQKLLPERLEPLARCAARLRDLLRHLERQDPRALAAARRVLAELLTEAGRRLRAAGVATFGALLRDAHRLVHEHADVAAQIRRELDQLLVDEFQDTDALQCELLTALALSGPEKDRPTLFLVGDPKQSIYGWRSADLDAYEEMKQRVRRAGGELGELSINRRSLPAVLAEVERLAAPVMHEIPGLQPSFRALEPHPDRVAKGGEPAVEHWLTFDRDPAGALVVARVGRTSELEAEALARDLARLRSAGVLLSRVGVLVRNTTGLEVVLDALRRAGVAFVVERETTHYERREVVDALAFMRCVLDPHDQLALVAALRAPAVGVPDAALAPLWREHFPNLVARLHGPDAIVWPELEGAVSRAAAAVPAGVPGIAALRGWPETLQAFLLALAELRRSAVQDSPERFVEGLRTRLLLEAAEAGRFLGRHRVASLDRLLRDLVEALDEERGSLSALLSALRRSGGIAREHEEGRPRSLDADAVQVMTIHRAKGQEFDHVYLLQTHREGSPPPEKETHLWSRAGRREYELLGMPTPGHWVVRRQRETVEAYERVRLLYVAATRARDRLVVSWSRKDEPAPDPLDAKKLADLVAHRAEASALARRIADAGGALDEDGVRWRLPSFALAEPPPRAMAEAAWAPEPNRVDEDAERLAQLCACAAARERRPWHAIASALAHEGLEERERPDGLEDALAGEPSPAPEAEPPDRERRIAMAAGTAVHAALERARLDAEPGEIAAEGAREIAAALATLEPADERRAAMARAHTIWERACAGELLARLRALAPQIVARELPVLLAPDAMADGDEAPVGFISGAIDLLYRGEGGALVVADYKTDDVAGADLAARAASYAPQGRVYTAAVQRALGLPEPPRFELWFLQAGCVEVA